MEVRDEICSAPALCAPDNTLKIKGKHDASDMGWGGYFYQEVAGEKDSKGYQKERVLKYVSGSFKDGQLVWPIFYKEAWSFVRTAAAGRYFLERSPWAFEMEGDQAALRWLKQCRKGPISAWLCEFLWGLQWTWTYMPGPDNVVADALSRYPCVTWGVTNFHGSVNVWRKLLAVLADDYKETYAVWIWAGVDSDEMAAMVQAWRSSRSALLRGAPKSMVRDDRWELALVAPAAEDAPVVCKALFEQARPFACLVPSDLVNWIALGAGRVADESVQKQVEASRKLSFLDPGITWVVRAAGPVHDYVMAIEPVEQA